MLVQISANWKVIKKFWVELGEQSSNGTLKLTASEDWTYVINWFFAWWYRFTKVKADQNVFGWE